MKHKQESAKFPIQGEKLKRKRFGHPPKRGYQRNETFHSDSYNKTQFPWCNFHITGCCLKKTVILHFIFSVDDVYIQSSQENWARQFAHSSSSSSAFPFHLSLISNRTPILVPIHDIWSNPLFSFSDSRAYFFFRPIKHSQKPGKSLSGVKPSFAYLNSAWIELTESARKNVLLRRFINSEACWFGGTEYEGKG